MQPDGTRRFRIRRVLRARTGCTRTGLRAATSGEGLPAVSPKNMARRSAVSPSVSGMHTWTTSGRWIPGHSRSRSRPGRWNSGCRRSAVSAARRGIRSTVMNAARASTTSVCARCQASTRIHVASASRSSTIRPMTSIAAACGNGPASMASTSTSARSGTSTSAASRPVWCRSR